MKLFESTASEGLVVRAGSLTTEAGLPSTSAADDAFATILMNLGAFVIDTELLRANEASETSKGRFPLRGTPVRLESPFEPAVAEGDWEALA